MSWQYLFAAADLSNDPISGRRGRWHVHPSQTLLGHARVETTMIYTHVVEQASRGVLRVRSPLDALNAPSPIPYTARSVAQVAELADAPA